MQKPGVYLLGLVCHITVVIVFAAVKDDRHGGVPMGVPNEYCDDGKHFLNIDWDPESTEEYTCHGERNPANITELTPYYHCDLETEMPWHICYNRSITYDEDLPTSGPHRPIWPKYGEYRYVPPQRWLHSLEHGAIVFLYHPCAYKYQINKLRAVAESCLRRHIISPSKRIPSNRMFAVLSWGCKLYMSEMDVTRTVEFVKDRAVNYAPERLVYADGGYDTAIIKHAKIVSDKRDSQICPENLLSPLSTKKISRMSRKRQERLERLRNILEQRSLNTLMSERLNSIYKR